MKWPALINTYCKINNHFSKGIDYKDPVLMPVYFISALILMGLVY